MEKPTIDQLLKETIGEVTKQNGLTPEMNDDVVAMLFGIYHQNQEFLKNQELQNEILTQLLTKEPIKVETKDIKFPSVIQTDVVNPVKEVSITKPSWYTPSDPVDLSPIMKNIDGLSTENNKGQMAIIEAIENLQTFLQTIDWSKIARPSGDYGAINKDKWYPETPAGAMNGSNRTFTLTQAPRANALFLYLNGILQTEGQEYTISRNVITYAVAPPNPQGQTYIHTAKYQV